MDIGRLALREEGDFWNAYWCPNTDNMDKSILLGSIRLNVVKGRIYEDYIKLMKDAFNVIAKETIGQTPTWSKPKPAPEDERSGNA
jgi:hypothetical protein